MKAPRVLESPAQFECRHERTVAFGDYSFIVGEIVAFHLRDGLCNERLRINYDNHAWVGRLTAGLYCHHSEGFSASAPGVVE